MFASRLKETRKKNGYTQATLAEALGVSKGTVAMWETAKRSPGYEKLCELADLLDVRIDYLLGKSDDASSPALSEEDIDQLGRWAVEDLYAETFARYISLDSYGKTAVEELIRTERLRCHEQGTLEDVSSVKFRIVVGKEKK